MTLLVTGAAGFIGMHVALHLLGRGEQVIGVDNLNSYYDVGLKRARLEQLGKYDRFVFLQLDVADRPAVERLFSANRFAGVVHLAAQAGVRFSISDPHQFIQSNLVGFANVLEGCRQQECGHLVYASSSSVYGGNENMPFREEDAVDHPVSLYAATKRANELMAHTYSHLYGIPTTGLRFFTVYGPWGRPDMAYFKFGKAILAGEPIPVFNNGLLQRDFTYIDDIVDGVVGVLDRPTTARVRSDVNAPGPSESAAPFRLLNIGNEQPVPLLRFIETLEAAFGKAAIKQFLPMQPGDVHATHADVSRLAALLGGTRPATPLDIGIRRFATWYRDYHGV